MAGGKETPRQKMIGMMYLVLTALLAMNVSKSILDSFLIINEGLEKSNEGLEDKNVLTMKAFEKNAQENPKKFQERYEKAIKIRKQAEDIFEHIEELKRYLIVKTDGLDTTLLTAENTPDSIFDLHNVSAKDNYDIPTNIMIGPDETNPKDSTVKYSALQLKMEIREFKEALLASFDPSIPEDQNIFHEAEKYFGFPLVKESDGTEVPWEIGNFYHLPIAAIITNLSRIQLDVLNIQADALDNLMKGADRTTFKVDSLYAAVVPVSTYVMSGDSFIANIFVSASSSSIVPEPFIGEKIDEEGNFDPSNHEADRIQDVGGGIIRYAYIPSGIGDHEWGGFLKVKEPGTGAEKILKIKPQSFKVAQKTLAVSATKMNIFYRGLSNPISATAPGIAPGDLTVSCTNGSVSVINKSRGEYAISPGNGKECKITLSGKGSTGERISFPPVEFRVKDVPPPVARFAGVQGSGTAPLIKVKSAQGVIADLENFEFEGVKYTVTSFTLSTIYKGNPVDKRANGNRLTDDQRSLINSLRSGSKLYVEDIVAQGPSGKPVKLGGIKIKIL